MTFHLSTIAAEVARRWVSANERRVRRGRHSIAATIEDVRDFADGIADGADATQLDLIADIALAKVQKHYQRITTGDHFVGAGKMIGGC